MSGINFSEFEMLKLFFVIKSTKFKWNSALKPQLLLHIQIRLKEDKQTGTLLSKITKMGEEQIVFLVDNIKTLPQHDVIFDEIKEIFEYLPQSQ